MRSSVALPALVPSVVLSVVLALVAASCGGDDGSALSVAGERGKQISTRKGCAGCHGADGGGGVGPPWIDLAGSTRELRDGSTVVADTAYLVRSIAEPEVDLLADYEIQMPRNDLDDAEIADVIAYIEDLSSPAPGPEN